MGELIRNTKRTLTPQTLSQLMHLAPSPIVGIDLTDATPRLLMHGWDNGDVMSVELTDESVILIRRDSAFRSVTVEESQVKSNNEYVPSAPYLEGCDFEFAKLLISKGTIIPLATQ